MRIVLFVVAALLALPAFAQEESSAPRVPTLKLQGEARREVVPDIAVLNAGVRTEKPTADEASRVNAQSAQALVEEIKRLGVPASDIRTTEASVFQIYDEEKDANGRTIKRTPRGFRAVNDLAVKLRDVSKAGATATRLISAGANALRSFDFHVSRKAEILEELRQEALKNAISRAQTYASIAGIKLVRILKIQIEPDAYNDNAADLPSRRSSSETIVSRIPLEPGVQTLTWNVQVTWEIGQ